MFLCKHVATKILSKFSVAALAAAVGTLALVGTTKAADDTLASAWGAYETGKGELVIVAHLPGSSGKTAIYDSRTGKFTPLDRTSKGLCAEQCSRHLKFFKTRRGDAVETQEAGESSVARRLPLTDADLSFTFQKIVHDGRVWRPDDKRMHPAVVLLGGTGNDLRDDFRIYPYLLAKAGYVAYAFDKQGTGNSAPDEEGIRPLAEQALAAVDAVRHLRGVDPERIGILGISHGAWVAVEAAKEDPSIAFIIPIVGGGVPLWRATEFEVHNTLAANGYGADQVREGDDFLSGLFAALRDGREGDVPALIAQSSKRPWFKDTPVAPFAGLPPATIKEIAAVRWRDELSYDPATALEQLHIPVFAVAAERDRSVPGMANLEGIARASGGRATTLLLQGANHHQALEARASFTYAPALAVNFEKWLAENLQRKGANVGQQRDAFHAAARTSGTIPDAFGRTVGARF